jgi:phenylacetate-CoA ligase
MISKIANLASMLRNERRNREVVGQIQNDAFLKLFRYAYDNVPFYRELYRASDISISDIRTLADIGKLPVTCKEQLQRAAANGKLWGNTDRYRAIETSGSSGLPFRFYVSEKENQWRKAQYLLPYVSTGRKPWDKVLRLTGDTDSPNSWIQRTVAFRETKIRSDAPTVEQYSALTMTAPAILQGYPSALRLLASYIRRNDLRCPPIRTVYTDSEILLPETRTLLREVFSADVIDVFGAFESDNIAYECSLHRGYHLAEDSVFAEVLADEGEESTDSAGELVCTVLHNTVTPFIRYNLRDKVRSVSGWCGCGRTSRRLSVIDGRASDLISFPDGTPRNSLSLIRVAALQFMDFADEFQIAQLKQDLFEVRLLRNRPLAQDDVVLFAKTFKDELPFARTRFRVVDKIQRTAAGKYKAFIALDSLANDA